MKAKTNSPSVRNITTAMPLKLNKRLLTTKDSPSDKLVILIKNGVNHLVINPYLCKLGMGRACPMSVLTLKNSFHTSYILKLTTEELGNQLLKDIGVCGLVGGKHEVGYAVTQEAFTNKYASSPAARFLAGEEMTLPITYLDITPNCVKSETTPTSVLASTQTIFDGNHFYDDLDDDQVEDSLPPYDPSLPGNAQVIVESQDLCQSSIEEPVQPFHDEDDDILSEPSDFDTPYFLDILLDSPSTNTKVYPLPDQIHVRYSRRIGNTIHNLKHGFMSHLDQEEMVEVIETLHNLITVVNKHTQSLAIEE